MADRYWVGGTAAWDATAGTKWALTSGGAGGQAVPTSADDVFFDAASGTVTVSMNLAPASCKNLNCTGFTGTLAATSGQLRPTGSVTLVAGMSLGSSVQLQLEPVGSQTLTSAGKTFFIISIGSAGATGTISLQDAISSANSLTITNGTFTTNGYNVTVQQLISSNSNARTINLDSSTVTISGTASPISFATNSGLNFNAGTSTILCTGSPASIIGGATSGNGVIFNNVSFTGIGIATHSIVGANTFNNLSITAPSSSGVTQVTFDSRQTINGTLSTTGTAGNRRVWFRGATYGIAQTLTVNLTPNLTDADFRDIYVIGTAAPVSGTRVGDLRGCSGITFDAPKTVYWNLAGGGNWSATAWAAGSGGAVSNDNFPLAQDTAIIENAGLNTSATVTLDSAINYFGTIDMFNRTNAMTLAGSTAYTVYGNWKFGSGVIRSYTGSLTFSGRNTQTITSAGKIFGQQIAIDTYGGTVEPADALNLASNSITVTNGTFDTKNYSITAAGLISSNSNVRTVSLGSSTLTLNSASQAISIPTSTNLTFNAGTSLIVLTSTSSSTPLDVLGVSQLYDVSFTNTSAYSIFLRGMPTTVRNLSFTAPASVGITNISLSSNFTITGTFTVAGATPIRRIFVRSDALDTPRTLTVGSLSATDCDFRDITITGAAANSTPTRAGDCGGNAGIVFPAAKTVYWNLAGTQNWSATAWADASGGTPGVNNFPLAQDVAVFDNAGAAGTITTDRAWNIGGFDASLRTSAMTLILNNSPSLHGDWKFGSGVTNNLTSTSLNFTKQGTQNITSNGVTFGCNLSINRVNTVVQLQDALVLDASKSLGVTAAGAIFDANIYNLTAGAVNATAANAIVKMGSGLWTITGTFNTVFGSIWDLSTAGVILYKGTANIVLSDTSTSARTFAGGGLSYNKLTIGGATGTSALTITGNNQFTELASTKTVAHTIALGATTQTFGKWTVSGTAGNVVTVTGSGTLHVIAGARVTGVDYLAMGTIGFSASSPGEFYAGANSTGSNATVIKTVAPTGTTRYWRGGTGTWDATSTTNWSDVSGGSGGATVPTSADAVVFDAASSAAAYTVTCTATQLRCGSLTFAAPASGNVTWAGTGALAVHDNFILPAVGLTRTYTGAITLSGSSAGNMFTSNGVNFANTITVNGVGCEWTLGSAVSGVTDLTPTNGSFDLASYNFTGSRLLASNNNSRSIIFGSGVTTLSSNFPMDFGTTETARANLTVTSNTSQIIFSFSSASTLTFNGNNQTFYNVSFTGVVANGTVAITGQNTFNNLSITGVTSAGLKTLSLTANQTINGILTIAPGTNATTRTFVQSDVLGTPRTLTCAAFSGTDADFRDIVIAGAAAPVSGTRLGDCKGNSGITFDAPKIVYRRGLGNDNWSDPNTWSNTSGGTGNNIYFPLAQDTAVFPASPTSYPGNNTSVTINAAHNIGTIDMSARTTNTMTLATGSTTPAIYGNWISGTGTTLTGSGAITFAGRGSQAITNAGKTFTQPLIVNTFGGSVTLQDAFSSNLSCTVIQGIFNANGYNVTLTNFDSGYATQRTVAIGSGTWTITASPWSVNPPTNLTVTGTGTVNLTSASAKTFAGGGVSYAGITLNQGGAGTLTITGNNTFADITSTYSATAATTIALGTTTQRVSKFSASGTVGKVLTVTGSSASSPATLIYTGAGQATTPTTNFLNIIGIRAYTLADTWYVGANSTNSGSLGLNFSNLITTIKNIFYGTIVPTQIYYGANAVSSLYYGSKKVWG